MKFRFSLDDIIHEADTTEPVSLGIPVEFGGEQPNFFGAELANADTLEITGFTGDTKRGGSCNVKTFTITPHCNGTHTECAGHVLDEPISVIDMVSPAPCVAWLISVSPEPADGCDERYSVPLDDSDRLITRKVLDDALQPLACCSHAQALVIRTLPNDADKCSRRYQGASSHPFFSIEGMERVLAMNVRHLLIDTPSVDRADDGGKLWVHRMFWGIEQGRRAALTDRLPKRSITEMIYVPDDVADGLFLLDLHIAPFVADAAPSRPILYPLDLVT